MASDVTISNALDYAESSSNSSAQLAGDFDEFLVLLTTQLQHQDPLDPASSTEFTSQLVAFAGVEQQINSNQRLESLVSLGLGTSFSSSLNYVGKDVSYLSSEGYYDGSTPIKINYAVEGIAVDTTINIYDEDSTLIYTHKVTDADEAESFTWDGIDKHGNEVDTGTYEVRIDALDGEDQALNTTTVITGHVSGVETQNGTTFLLVGERAVSIGKIINVHEVAATTETETSSDESTDTEDESSQAEQK